MAVGGTARGAAAPVSAGPDRCQLNWRTALSCHKPNGSPAINATQPVVNHIHHGLGGFWTYLDYRRTHRVWGLDGVYRALVTYHGRFDGVEGPRATRAARN